MYIVKEPLQIVKEYIIISHKHCVHWTTDKLSGNHIILGYWEKCKGTTWAIKTKNYSGWLTVLVEEKVDLHK